jgi:hypothetical protein
MEDRVRMATVSRFAAYGAFAACVVLCAACGGSNGATGSTGATGSAAPTSAQSTSGSPATPASSAGFPTDCSAITSVVGPFLNGVGTTKSFSSSHLSCEFINQAGTSIIIVNIGPGSPSSFALLRSKSGGDGRTITSVGGFGAEAFSVSMNGQTRGFAVLTEGDALYSVETNFPLAKDEALVKALEAHS